VSPDSAPVVELTRSPTASACEPFFDFIELSLCKGRNAKAIYQDLVDDYGFTARYQSVKRFVRQLRGPISYRYIGRNENFVLVTAVQAASLRPTARKSASRSSQTRW
jgi:hypothetical protein